MLRIVLVANLPPPYRVPIYQRIAALPGVRLHVLFCCRREPNRQWDLPPLDFEHTFLKERFITIDGRYIHNNPDVLKHLRRIAPDVVVTNGFNPTHLYACFYAFTKQRRLVLMTDGTDVSERKLTALHRVMRHLVYARADAFIAASAGGRRLYQSYGIAPERCFLSPLCAHNQAYAPGSAAAEKKFDFIFSGRIEPVKNPLFALEVAVDVAKKLQRQVSIVFVGAGSMEAALHSAAGHRHEWVDAYFTGFATQEELPGLYHSARILLMPTRWDPWGMVVNEACAAGLPVLISPAAGAAGELVRDGENGYVSEPDLDEWSAQACALLTEPALYQRFSQRSRELVAGYTFETAAEGFIGACRAAHQRLRLGWGQPLPASRPRVVIVERQLPHYRVALYQRLRKLLAENGIDLQLLIGDRTPAGIYKQNQPALDWSILLPTRYLLRKKICWQPFGVYARGADLVIVMHENRLLYKLWLLSLGRPRRLAFWSHGRNMQSARPGGLMERFRRWTDNRVDWWFAYTDGSAALPGAPGSGAPGFPRARTTFVGNAFDTREMMRFCKEVTLAQYLQARARLHLGSGPIGLYVGSPTQEARLDFLLNAARRIRDRIPGFQLLIADPGQADGQAAAPRHAGVYYLGPLQARDKAQALVLADVMLNPGLAGSGVLDSFISGTPMLATRRGSQSPEISGLSPGLNGIVTDDDVNVYAEAVIAILRDPKRLITLRGAALASAPRYTAENMADRISNGIVTCLSAG